LANRIAATLSREDSRKRFLRLQSGEVDQDMSEAVEVATNGPGDRDIDTCIDLAMNVRWVGDLTVAERIARAQQERAMAQDLASREHDWPERVARSAYEFGMALSLQGRYYELDEVCRDAYMRFAGSIWAGWEYSLRSIPRFAEGAYAVADRHLETAIELLHLEGFQDFTRSLVVGRAACHRMLGDTTAARAFVHEASDWKNNGVGTLSIIAAEDAELSVADGDVPSAAETWNGLAQSGLPLWRGVAHLRLAERGFNSDENARRALGEFQQVKSLWGVIRTTALINGSSEADVAAEVEGLGPGTVFMPGGPWYF
jgi:hypothetical protein